MFLHSKQECDNTPRWLSRWPIKSQGRILHECSVRLLLQHFLQHRIQASNLLHHTPLLCCQTLLHLLLLLSNHLLQ